MLTFAHLIYWMKVLQLESRGQNNGASLGPLELLRMLIPYWVIRAMSCWRLFNYYEMTSDIVHCGTPQAKSLKKMGLFKTGECFSMYSLLKVIAFERVLEEYRNFLFCFSCCCCITVTIRISRRCFFCLFLYFFAFKKSLKNMIT